MPTTPRTAVTLTCDELRLLIGRTLPFAATDNSRPVLHGIKLELAPGRIIAAAADGYILGVQTSPATIEHSTEEGVILPLADAKAWERMVPKTSQDVRVRLSWGGPGPLRLELYTPGMPAKPAVKAQGSINGHRPVEAAPATKATPDVTRQSAECWPIQGSYPNYVNLIPEWDGHDSLGAIAINHQLLERVLKAWKAGRDHNAGIMRWHVTTPASPITLTEQSYEGCGFLAVVMPMWVELGTDSSRAQHKAEDGTPAPIYDYEDAQATHRGILAQVLPPQPAKKAVRKPAAKRAAKPAPKRASKPAAKAAPRRRVAAR